MTEGGLLSRFAVGRTKAAILAMVAVILIVASHSLWLPSVGSFLIVTDPLQPADALVALAGGRERVV
jgi:hypothetical protein